MIAEKATSIASRVGIDPSVIIAIITAILQALSGCKKTPKEAESVARAQLKENPHYFGWRLDRRRKRRIIADNTPDGTDPEDVEAAVDDELDRTTSDEFSSMYSEVQQALP